VQAVSQYLAQAQGYIRELGHRLMGAAGVDEDVLEGHRVELDRLRLSARQV
jgi:hypothetical protein